jgi:glyoxylase-like metal-dependent hydrolase (beta-lactamase superfamily II)
VSPGATGEAPYAVYALKYAERDTTACQFLYREPSHATLTLHYYVWLIVGGARPVLVDTGCGPEEARARGFSGYVSPAAMVERAGLRAAEVPLALITHLHYDHWDGHGLFPAAEFWVQREEAAFWTGPGARAGAFWRSASVAAVERLPALQRAGRVRLLDGDREVLPGVRVHRVGGHTPGLQVVSVDAAGGPVVLASDAAHFYRNVETRQPVQAATSLPDMLAAFETIRALAGAGGRIVAGHDPLVAERFTLVEPGIVRIA